MKRFCALLLCAVLLCMALPWQTRAAEMDVNAKSALLRSEEHTSELQSRI